MDSMTTWINNIILPLNAHVFVHSWNKVDSFEQGTGEFGYHREVDATPNLLSSIPNIIGFEISDASIVLGELLSKAKPFIRYRDIITKNEKYKHLQRLKQGAFSSNFYSVKKSIELVEGWSKHTNIKYDIIIKSRMDVKPIVDRVVLEKCLQEPDKFWVDIGPWENIDYVKDENKYSSIKDVPSIHDMMIISSLENMIKYKSLYDNGIDIILSALEKDRPETALNPHERIYEHLVQTDLISRVDYRPLMDCFNSEEAQTQRQWFFNHPQYSQYSEFYDKYDYLKQQRKF